MADPDVAALERRIKACPLAFPAADEILRLIQRLRESETQREQLQRMFDACQRVEQRMAARITQLEIVRDAARKVIDPAEKLLTHKPRDWNAVIVLEAAIAATDASDA